MYEIRVSAVKEMLSRLSREWAQPAIMGLFVAEGMVGGIFCFNHSCANDLAGCGDPLVISGSTRR